MIKKLVKWFMILAFLFLNFSISTQFREPLLDAKTQANNDQIVNLNLSDYLVYPGSNKFKAYILPYLNSKHIVELFHYYQKFNPYLSFKKFLPHEYKMSDVLSIVPNIDIPNLEGLKYFIKFHSNESENLILTKNEFNEYHVFLVEKHNFSNRRIYGYVAAENHFSQKQFLNLQRFVLDGTKVFYYGKKQLDENMEKIFLIFTANEQMEFVCPRNTISTSNVHKFLKSVLKEKKLEIRERFFWSIIHHLQILFLIFPKYVIWSKKTLKKMDRVSEANASLIILTAKETQNKYNIPNCLFSILEDFCRLPSLLLDFFKVWFGFHLYSAPIYALFFLFLNTFQFLYVRDIFIFLSYFVKLPLPSFLLLGDYDKKVNDFEKLVNTFKIHSGTLVPTLFSTNHDEWKTVLETILISATPLFIGCVYIVGSNLFLIHREK